MAAEDWDQFPDAPPATQALTRLTALGVQPTSGFRTESDVQRLKGEGYTPAENGAHNKGDGIDLVPGKTGWSLSRLQAEARREFGAGAVVQIHNGTHVHVAVPGWGLAPDLYRNNQWDEFKDTGSASQRVVPQSGALTATGQAHDGDTIRLMTGQNGRLLGYDAFELNQTGRRSDGEIVPLGQQAHNYLLPNISAGQAVLPTGGQTYGRPVVNLSSDPMSDPAHNALRLGYGMAEPDFLKGTDRFGPYMEAERLARLNHLGGFATNAETPSQFRHKDGPWQGAEPAAYGQGQVTFFDDPTPFYGLRPEIAKAYRDFALHAKSPSEIVDYAKANGFTVPIDVAKNWIEQRDKAHGNVAPGVQYLAPPRPVIDPGDGAFGSFARGFGDPVNILDETGAVVDSLGGTGGRENLWNSDRRFGDILWNNIDQNRAILEHDQSAHPVARIGGQLTSGVALPMGAASTPLRLGAIMAAEGGIAGFGAGEGGVTGRLPNAALGAAIGAVAGPALGLAAEHVVSPIVSKGVALLRRARVAAADGVGDAGREAAYEAAPIINDGIQNAGPTPAARSQPQGGVTAAMTAKRGPEVVGPVIASEAHPGGSDAWSEFADAPFNTARNINEHLSPEEMAKLAEGVDPASVLPRPASAVESLDDATKANPGRFEDVQALDEHQQLPVRAVTTATGGKVNVRGPLDITQSLRLMGGVKDDGGDLAHLGITNAPRRMDFGSNEQFLGKLINDDTGLSLDDATHALWEEGYFPGFKERPTTHDLLDRLRDENTGAQRYFHPDDLGYVEEFDKARADRHLIEQAQERGSPLANERGHEITLDDLAANTPPTSAYEDGPRLMSRVGNINLDRLEKPKDVAALIDQISNRVGGFSAASRGRVTHEETQQLAEELGLRPEQLLKRRQGQALNAEQMFASRALVQRSREAVARLAKKALGGSDEDVATFRKAWLKHVALEEQIAGATSEAGRLLSQFRMVASAQSAGADAVRSYLKGAGGKESIEDAAGAILDLMKDPTKASHFMREAVKPRWRDKFNELYINSLLSGPKTHVVNFVGNALTTMMSFPELAATAAIGKVTRSDDRALFGEVGARAAGLADSSMDALRAMKTAFKTGEPLDDVSKVEAVNHQAIGGRLGKVIRTPTRALTAADEFWKSLLSHAELHQEAYRVAKREATDPEAFRSRYDALVRNPTDEMVKRSKNAARYWTFQRELGPVGRGVQQISNNWVLGKILLSFVRTPSNIIKFAGERSVFGLAMPEVRAALKAGGRARDEALAKITLGSGLSTAAVVAALDGRITGSGPSDPDERAALIQSGWQANSIRIGDRWVSYGRFDPVATLLGVAADFAEAGKWATNKEADIIAVNLAKSIAKNITSKTWLSGLSDAFDVLSDPDRYGPAYMRKEAASIAVPAALAQTAQALDPNLRDARTVMDAIKARVPFVSKSLPARLNPWGEPMTNGNSVGPDLVSPFYAQRIDRSPFAQEIARLQAPLSMPQRSIIFDRRKVQLTPQQYSEYVQLAGKPAKAALQQEMASPEWKHMTDDERREMIKETISDMRGAARDALISNHPELGGSAAPRAPANDAWAEFKDVRSR